MVSASPLPWHALRTPKRGHTEAEYEDAWAANARAGRFAVADGASESSYAGLWANLLAETFVAARRPLDGLDWLDDPRRRWSAAVDGRELAWYAEIKRTQGAFATLLGVAVRPAAPGRPGRWQALAIGDSCLVRVRDGGTPRAFPLSKAADFSNQPALLGSRPGPAPAPVLSRGACRPGDRLFLMTDALAQWFLLRSESNRRPWEDLARLLADPKPGGAFAAWVAEHRDGGDLRNDDVTLLAIGPFPATADVSKE
jgi:protein phosphatase 2C-like protein